MLYNLGHFFCEQVGEKPISGEPVASVRSLCEKMGHVTIVCKGENDIISDGVQGK